MRIQSRRKHFRLKTYVILSHNYSPVEVNFPEIANREPGLGVAKLRQFVRQFLFKIIYIF